MQHRLSSKCLCPGVPRCCAHAKQVFYAQLTWLCRGSLDSLPGLPWPDLQKQENMASAFKPCFDGAHFLYTTSFGPSHPKSQYCQFDDFVASRANFWT
eukprot:1159377-Pelagomonas_calceolata.AAC.6